MSRLILPGHSERPFGFCRERELYPRLLTIEHRQQHFALIHRSICSMGMCATGCPKQSGRPFSAFGRRSTRPYSVSIPAAPANRKRRAAHRSRRVDRLSLYRRGCQRIGRPYSAISVSPIDIGEDIDAMMALVDRGLALNPNFARSATRTPADNATVRGSPSLRPTQSKDVSPTGLNHRKSRPRA